MPARRRNDARILPTPTVDDPYPAYPHNGGYRYVTVAANGAKKPSETFPTKELAAEERAADQRIIDGVADVAIDEALVEYEAFLHDSGWKVKPRGDHMAAIRQVFTDGAEMVEALTKKRCQALYDDLRKRTKPSTAERCKRAGNTLPHERRSIKGCLCRRYSNTTQRNWLCQARMFNKWLVGREYVKANCMALVEGIGPRSKGKRQLRIDEIRKFITAAHGFASRGEEGAVAAMLALMMGLRAGEIVARIVLDVDDDGTKLHVTEVEAPATDEDSDEDDHEEGWDPKSAAGKRVRVLPEELRGYIRALCQGKAPSDLLWNSKHDGGWVTDWATKICAAAGVRRVTAHGLRATHNESWVDEEEVGEKAQQAAGMGHTSFDRMTGPVYSDPSGLARRTQRKFLRMVKGGK